MSMTAPLISIIIPVYRVEKYLTDCLDSIVCQLAPDTEVILVDDGSPDRCPEICDEYAGKHKGITVIHQANEGVSLARQKGVAHAAGQYLTFVDSDDWVEPDFINEVRRMIEGFSPDIICFGYNRVSGNVKAPGSFPAESRLYTKKEIVSEIFPMLVEDRNGRYFPNSLWGKVFRRELYAENQVTGCKIMMGEDAACVKPCIYHADSLYTDRGAYYNYRLTDSSVTASGRPLLWDGPVLIAEHYRRHMDLSQYGLDEQVVRNVVHNVFNVAVSQFSRGDTYSGTSGLIKKELKDPYYVNAASSAHFSSIEGVICKMAIKYRLPVIMYLRWLQKHGRKKKNL